MDRKDFIKRIAVLPTLGLGLTTLSSVLKEAPDDKKMPVLFVGHGNPMNALQENDFTRGWRQMVKGLKPLAILCISAHWETRGTKITMTPKPKTIHDFGGFPQALFDIEYPAPGAPEIGKNIINQVHSTSVLEDHQWGLDHGTWTVVMKMFPEANVPVLQLSLNYNMSPKMHYELAKELAFLRQKGILIIGSGNIIHNLGLARWNSNTPYDWAIQFDEKVKQLIQEKNHQALIDFSKLGKMANLSIPTTEHYLPMLYILALQEKQDQVAFFNESIDMGSMAMRSFIIG